MNIVVVGNVAQRINDQLILCKSLKKINESFNFIFILEKPEYSSFFKQETYVQYICLENKRSKKKKNKQNILIQKKIISKSSKKRIKNLINNSKINIFELIRFCVIYIRYNKNYYKYKRRFNKIKPFCILANGDRHRYMEQVLLKIAKKQRIKIVIPYFVFSHEAILFRLNDPKREVFKNSSFIVKVAAKIFSKQLYIHEKRKLLFYTPSDLFALKLFGTLSAYPWNMGNGISDLVCVNCKHVAQRYKANKVRDDKMEIIGDIAYDQLYEAYRNKSNIKDELIQEFELDTEKNIIIVALPQLWEHQIMSQDDHWNEIEFIMQTLSKLKSNVLVSLHPRMNINNYLFLEDKYKCRIVRKRLFEFLPVADLFIATYSSTVLWSVLCGNKTLVFDFYGLNYDMFNFLTSISFVNKKSEFNIMLEQQLHSKVDFSKDWDSLSREHVFDGKTILRYEQLINMFI